MKLTYLIILIFVSLILIIFGILSVDNSKNVTDEDEKTPVSEESEDPDIDAIEKVNNLEQFFIDKLPVTNINEISNQTKLNFGLYILNSESNLLKVSYFDSVFEDYFGDDFQYFNEDILDLSTNQIIATYDDENKEYTLTDDYAYDFSLPYQLLSKGSFEKTDDTFNLHRQYLFVDISQSPYLLYSSYQNYLNNINSIGNYDVATTNNMISSSIVDNYKEILPTVSYSFKKNKNNYILQSISIT